MDQKSRAAMAKTLCRQLDISPDQCNEQLLAAIAKAPGGSQFMEILTMVAKAPGKAPETQSASKNLKAAVASATHKLDIPARAAPAAAIEREFREELKLAAFLEVVEKVVTARCDEEEAKLEAGCFQTAAAIQANFKLEAMKRNLEDFKEMGSGVKKANGKFLDATAVPVRNRLLDSSEETTELLGAVKEAVNERLEVRRSAAPHGKSEKHERVMQSKIEYRVQKIFGKGLSLRDFVSETVDECGDDRRQVLLEAIHAAVSERSLSIKQSRDVIQGAAAQLDTLQEELKGLRTKPAALDAEIATLRAKLIKEHDKFVKLNKISFTMRLDKAIKAIQIKAKNDAYKQALATVQAEEAQRKSLEPVPVLDPTTGFEVPFYPLSELALQNKLKSLLEQTRKEYTNLQTAITGIQELSGRLNATVTERVPGAVAEAVDKLDEFSLQIARFCRLVTESQLEPVECLNLMTTQSLQDFWEGQELLMENSTPKVPVTDQEVDLPGLQLAATEATRLMSDHLIEGRRHLDTLNSMMDQTIRFREQSGEGPVQAAGGDCDISPVLGEDSSFVAMMKRVDPTGYRQAAPPAFVTSTPYVAALGSKPSTSRGPYYFSGVARDPLDFTEPNASSSFD